MEKLRRVFVTGYAGARANHRRQHSARRADGYLAGSGELARWELAHRRRLSLGIAEAWFAPPESVIIHKLVFHREGGSEKHLEDIRGILVATPVDRSLIAARVDRLGLAESWSSAKTLRPERNSSTS